MELEVQRLPRFFLVRLGKYVVTCAGIERSLATINSTLDHEDHTQFSTAVFDYSKSSSDQLTKKLSAHADHQKVEVGIQMRYVANRINEFIGNRHMSVHGVWSWEKNILSVSFRAIKGTADYRDRKITTKRVSLDEVNEVLNDAEDLLKRLLWVEKNLTHPSSAH